MTFFNRLLAGSVPGGFASLDLSTIQRKQDAGEQVVIIDLRPGPELDLDPLLIPGAIHLGMEEVELRHHEIPRDRDVIVYCSCPNEVSSARMALLLHRKGLTRVRPLLGGIGAWRELNYPLVPAARPAKPLATITPTAPPATPPPGGTAAQDKSTSRANLPKAA